MVVLEILKLRAAYAPRALRHARRGAAEAEVDAGLAAELETGTFETVNPETGTFEAVDPETGEFGRPPG